MLRRLHIAMVYALVAVFVSTSTTGAVVASFTSPSTSGAFSAAALSMSAGQRDGMEHAHHDHERAMESDQSKRDCLAYCFEAMGELKLSGAPAYLFQPRLNATEYGRFVQPALNSILHSSLGARGARGPPGFYMAHAPSGLSGVLMLNRRLRI